MRHKNTWAFIIRLIAQTLFMGKTWITFVKSVTRRAGTTFDKLVVIFPYTDMGLSVEIDTTEFYSKISAPL